MSYVKSTAPQTALSLNCRTLRNRQRLTFDLSLSSRARALKDLQRAARRL